MLQKNELRELAVKAFNPELDMVMGSMQQKENQKADLAQHQKLKTHICREESEVNRISNGLNCTNILDQQLSSINDTSLSSPLPQCSAPVCRQFWKAGNYDEGLAFKSTLQSGSSYLHIHPKFLHSNATSHKWAFGAIAELIDNAVDEIQNGATLVIVDKTSNPRNGSPALLIQDDGGGMDPEAMRRCLSFGFSDKKSKSAIGQYGNGFKTSSMRLGADAVVFTCHLKERKLTQSIGLLSYSFLKQTGHDRIVVPMVDYEFNTSTGAVEMLDRYGKDNFKYNLSMLLQWSPYSTEAELLHQFDDIGYRGTKIVIYNLWLNDDGTMELDFDSDPEDICITRDAKLIEKGTNRMAISEHHMANKFHHSLRVYLSILYLRIPENFCIILRGRVVEYHNIASDLKFPECILYKPLSGGTVITTIGFLKEAPHVNIHGFNIYHKNRLILPFWHAVNRNDSRGRGVVGVLEANFIEPTHNKQDFEKTSVFQKLENRLKEMTWEYWDHHCGLIGYQVTRKSRAPMPSLGSADGRPHCGVLQPVGLESLNCTSASAGVAHRHPEAVSSSFLEGIHGQALQWNSQQGEHFKRKQQHHLAEDERAKRRAGGGISIIDAGANQEIQPIPATGNQLEDQGAISLMKQNKSLRAQCIEHEKREEELKMKVTQLRSELGEVQHEYARLLIELDSRDNQRSWKDGVDAWTNQ